MAPPRSDDDRPRRSGKPARAQRSGKPAGKKQASGRKKPPAAKKPSVGRKPSGGSKPSGAKRGAAKQQPGGKQQPGRKKKSSARRSSGAGARGAQAGRKPPMGDRRPGQRAAAGRSRQPGGSAAGDGAAGSRSRQRSDGRADPSDPREELRRVAGPVADRSYARLMEAAEAYQADRHRDARRLLEPLRERHPEALSIRELLGLTYYRMGRYREALKELGLVVERTGTTEQHPVLMDCHRAQGAYEEVEALWDDLRRVSPSGEAVTEGRIVMAGALSDQGRLADAIRLLEKGPTKPKVVRDHHLRLWYALADLEERAGNLPRARTLFDQIRRREADFADVAERLASLG